MECRGAFLSPNAKPPTYHYCSWYHLDSNFGIRELQDLLNGLKTVEPKPRLDAIQIDASYFPHAGDWLEPSSNFPGTFRTGAEAIAAAGYTPGVWIAPFMVGNRSRLATEHPDWLLHDADGTLIRRWRRYLGNREWGLPDTEIIPLDTSHPEAFEYLRRVFRTFREWGIGFYKTDFMDWGLYDSATVRRATPGKTGQQYLRDVLEMIREEIGEESYWLGCILPFSASLGLVDGMRIGNDVPAEWSRASAGNMVQEMLSDQYFNNVWWQNDPDVLYLRSEETFLSWEETESLALLAALSGGSINTSDDLSRIGEKGRTLWAFLEPGRKAFTASVPDWSAQVATEGGPGIKRLLKSNDNGSVTLLVFNGTEREVIEELRVRDYVASDRAFVAAWGTGLLEQPPPAEMSAWHVKLAPRQSRLFRISRKLISSPSRLIGD